MRVQRQTSQGQRNGRGRVGEGLELGLRLNMKIFYFGFQRNLRYYSHLVNLDDCMAITARSENRFSAGVFRYF